MMREADWLAVVEEFQTALQQMQRTLARLEERVEYLERRDPHWRLGVEHGRDGAEPYTFADAENQRRYVEGYERGRLGREDCAAHPSQQAPPLASGDSWKR